MNMLMMGFKKKTAANDSLVLEVPVPSLKCSNTVKTAESCAQNLGQHGGCFSRNTGSISSHNRSSTCSTRL